MGRAAVRALLRTAVRHRGPAIFVRSCWRHSTTTSRLLSGVSALCTADYPRSTVAGAKGEATRRRQGFFWNLQKIRNKAAQGSPLIDLWQKRCFCGLFTYLHGVVAAAGGEAADWRPRRLAAGEAAARHRRRPADAHRPQRVRSLDLYVRTVMFMLLKTLMMFKPDGFCGRRINPGAALTPSPPSACACLILQAEMQGMTPRVPTPVAC